MQEESGDKANWQSYSNIAARPNSETDITWSASEFIAHQKGSSWYMILALATIALAALVYFVTEGDIVSTVVVFIVAMAFGAFAGRPPRTLDYAITGKHIQIGKKAYDYDMFKSFSVIDEGALNCIWLMPMKRFMLPIVMYYDPKDEDRILDMLSQYLPYEQREHDRVDKWMRKIRF